MSLEVHPLFVDVSLSVSFQDEISSAEATEQAEDDEPTEEGDGEKASTDSSGASDWRHVARPPGAQSNRVHTGSSSPSLNSSIFIGKLYLHPLPQLPKDKDNLIVRGTVQDKPSENAAQGEEVVIVVCSTPTAVVSNIIAMMLAWTPAQLQVS